MSGESEDCRVTFGHLALYSTGRSRAMAETPTSNPIKVRRPFPLLRRTPR